MRTYPIWFTDTKENWTLYSFCRCCHATTIHINVTMMTIDQPNIYSTYASSISKTHLETGSWWAAEETRRHNTVLFGQSCGHHYHMSVSCMRVCVWVVRCRVFVWVYHLHPTTYGCCFCNWSRPRRWGNNDRVDDDCSVVDMSSKTTQHQQYYSHTRNRELVELCNMGACVSV